MGSPKSINGLETGDLLGWPSDLAMSGYFKELAPNFTSVYQLLPTSRYPQTFLRLYDPFNYDSINYKYCTYNQAVDLLKGRDWAKTSSGAAKTMFSAAMEFHNSLLTNLGPTKVYYLYCNNYNNTITSADYRNYGDNKPLLYQLQYNNDGDGTVPSASARNGLPSSDPNCFAFSNAEHGKLPADALVQKKIKEIIDGNITLNSLGTTQSQNYKSFCVLLQGFENVNIRDDEGNNIVRDGENLIAKTQSGDKIIGTDWLINSETSRHQYVLLPGNYTFNVSSDTNFGKSEVEVIHLNGNQYESDIFYGDLGNAKAVRLNIKLKGSELYNETDLNAQGDSKQAQIKPTHIFTNEELQKMSTK